MNARGCGQSATAYEIKVTIFKVKRPEEILVVVIIQ